MKPTAGDRNHRQRLGSEENVKTGRIASDVKVRTSGCERRKQDSWCRIRNQRWPQRLSGTRNRHPERQRRSSRRCSALRCKQASWRFEHVQHRSVGCSGDLHTRRPSTYRLLQCRPGRRRHTGPARSYSSMPGVAVVSVSKFIDVANANAEAISVSPTTNSSATPVAVTSAFTRAGTHGGAVGAERAGS